MCYCSRQFLYSILKLVRRLIWMESFVDYTRIFWYTKQKYHALIGMKQSGGRPMADNKQYITQIQDNGTVMISEDVVATIVAQAVKDVDGVVTLSTKPAAELADMIGKKNWGKGTRITISENNAITIECDVLMGYGQSVVAVASAVQVAVANAVESMTGVHDVTVNVNVSGIIRQ